MIRIFTGITAILAIAAGCAAPLKYDYTKEGSGKFEKENAFSECTYQIKLNKIAATDQKNLENLCMQGKGYRYKRVN